MTAATSYLAELAGRLADKDPSPESRHRKAPSLPVHVPSHVDQEILFAADLFESTEKAIRAELTVLGAAGVLVDPTSALAVSAYLVRLSAELRIRLIQSQEGRANGL